MPTSDLSFLNLVLNASPLVQLVMATLLLASILSWTMIFDRSRVLKRAQRRADDFEDRFWSGGDLADLYRRVERDRDDATGLAAIFHAGFREFARLRESPGIEPAAIVEGARRAMRVALSREMDYLETHLNPSSSRINPRDSLPVDSYLGQQWAPTWTPGTAPSAKRHRRSALNRRAS